MQIGFNKPESQVKSRMKNDKPVETAIKAILALFFVVPHFEKLSRNLPQQPSRKRRSKPTWLRNPLSL